MSVMVIQTTLVVHAIGASIIFIQISLFYFTKFGYTSSLQTAIAFIAIVMLMDFFLVGLIINRKSEKFGSLLGTWIPFGLIFLSKYLAGLAFEVQGMTMRLIQSNLNSYVIQHTLDSKFYL